MKENDSNDSDFPLKLMEKTTNIAWILDRKVNGTVCSKIEPDISR